MKKNKYTRQYFKRYGSNKKNYISQKYNPTFSKILSEFKQLGYFGNILDIGCAHGFFLKECLLNDFPIYGIDISPYIVNKAKKLLKSKNISTIDLSIKKLPFKSNFFKIVTMLDSLEHIENPQNALRESYRVLKKGGLLHIRLPGFKRGLTESTHVNYYTIPSLRVLLEKHSFKILKLGEEGGFLQLPFGLLRLIRYGNTNFNYVPVGGKFISCYAMKINGQPI